MNKRTTALLIVVLAIAVGLWRWSASQPAQSTGLKLAVGKCLSDSGTENNILLTVLSSGTIDLNGTPVQLPVLAGQLHEALKTQPADARIYVRAANDTDFQSVIDVLDIAKTESGNVELLASQKACPDDPPIPGSE